MPKAVARNTTLTILDTIALQRGRFGIINNPNPIPAKSATMRAVYTADFLARQEARLRGQRREPCIEIGNQVSEQKG